MEKGFGRFCKEMEVEKFYNRTVGLVTIIVTKSQPSIFFFFIFYFIFSCQTSFSPSSFIFPFSFPSSSLTGMPAVAISASLSTTLRPWRGLHRPLFVRDMHPIMRQRNTTAAFIHALYPNLVTPAPESGDAVAVIWGSPEPMEKKTTDEEEGEPFGHRTP